MALNVSVIVSAIDRLSGPVKGMSSTMQGLRTAGAWMTGAGAAINGTLLAVAGNAAKSGAEIYLLSQKTGVSAAALSQLKYAAEQTGGSLDTVQAGLRFVSKTAFAAANGNDAAAAAYKRLGVDVLDSNGKLKSADVLMSEAGEGLRSLTNGAERSALAMQIFGRGGTAMLPMIMDARGGIKGLREEADKLGLTMSEKNAEAAHKYEAALKQLSAVSGSAVKSIGTAIIPTLTAVVQWFAAGASSVKWFAKEHPGLIKVVALTALALGFVLSTLGPILVLLPALVNGWKILSVAMSWSTITARASAVATWAAGAAAKTAGLWASISAGGWSGLAASTWAAVTATWAYVWPVLLVVAGIVTLIGAIRRMLDLFDLVKNHKWAEAMKKGAEGLIPGDFLFEGGKQILKWVNDAKASFSNDLKLPEGSGAPAGTDGSGAVSPETVDVETMKTADAAAAAATTDAAAETKGAASDTADSAGALKDAAEELVKGSPAGTQATAYSAPQTLNAPVAPVYASDDQRKIAEAMQPGSFGAAFAESLRLRLAPVMKSVAAITTAAGFSAGAPQRAFSRYDFAGTPPIVPTGQPNEYRDLRGGTNNQGRMILTPEQATAILRGGGGQTQAGTVHYAPTYAVTVNGGDPKQVEAAVRKAAATIDADFQRKFPQQYRQQQRQAAVSPG